MAYCRFGEERSTVYAWDAGGSWRIAYGGRSVTLKRLEDLRDYLTYLRVCGETVPQSAFERIDAELRGEDPSAELWNKLIEDIRAEVDQLGGYSNEVG